MKPEFVRPARFAGSFSTRLKAVSVLTILGLALTGCGSLFGDDAPDTSAPLGAVVGPERNDKGLTGVGRVSQAAAVESIAGGFVVSDEPQASLAARNVLEQGGTAADAAVALYFTLSITQPQAAGLGGGGVCLASNPGTGVTESIEFLPREATAGGGVAVPGNVRGFALLHARHGRTSWSKLLAPAERLAATGTPMSRAMVQALAPYRNLLASQPQLLPGYAGTPLRELENLSQIQLAATLGQIRSQGVNAFYVGDGANRLARGIQDAGGKVSANDLRNYRPVVSATQKQIVQGAELHLPSRNTGAGAFAGALWEALQQTPAGDGQAAYRIAIETAAKLGAAINAPNDTGATGFAVASARGDAVACAVTLNGAFGAQRSVHGRTITLATTPVDPVKGLASAFLAPVMITGPNSSGTAFAGAAGGSPAATAGVLQTLRQTLGDGKSVTDALASATPDRSARVNAIACPKGLPFGFASCSFGVDPDGAGLGVEAIGR